MAQKNTATDMSLPLKLMRNSRATDTSLSLGTYLNTYLLDSDGKPEIVMPPLSPPPECAEHLEIRDDDTEPVIRKRLQVCQV